MCERAHAHTHMHTHMHMHTHAHRDIAVGIGEIVLKYLDKVRSIATQGRGGREGHDF